MGKKIPYFLGLLLTIFTVWVFVTSNTAVRTVVERMDNIAYDLQLRARIYTHPRPTLSPIAIVDIDDDSLKAVGHWPWSRDKLATLVDRLQENRVLAVVFDIIFAESQPNIADTLLTKLSGVPSFNLQCSSGIKENAYLFDEDNIFAKSLANTRALLANTYLMIDHTENALLSPITNVSPKILDQLGIDTAEGYIANIPALQQPAKGEGFVTIEPDIDGVARHAGLIIRYKDHIYPSLALQTILSIFGDTVTLVTPTYKNELKLEGLKIGKLFLPTDARGTVLIPFVGRSHTFPTYSAIDVLNNHLSSDALVGKIVLIGTSAIGLGDIHTTAVQTSYPGVEVQATMINGILQNNFSYIPAWTYGANLSFILIFGLLATFLFPAFGPRLLGIAIVFMPIALLIFNNLIWTFSGFIFSSVLPVMLLIFIAFLNIIYGYLFESRKREHLRNIFGQYVPEKHIDEMMGSTDALSLHGEDREMTVLFADIRNFTTISEKMEATELVKMLNQFFTPMTEIIFKHRGTIDKYVGDMLMAFWGAPLKDKNHVRHALECTLEMDAKLKSMRGVWEDQDMPEIKIGMGLNTGHMSVGDMGSRFRRNYTVLGDAVNLASRLESLTKLYGVDIIVSESMQHHQPKFVFRRLDKVRVKGREIITEIYELVCLQSNLTEPLKQEIEQFHKALDYYFQKEWENAEVILNTLAEKYPYTKLYKLYLSRINEFKQNPPPADWNGVHSHVSK